LKRVEINQVIYFLNLDYYMKFFLIPKLMLISKIAMSQIMLPAYQGVVSKIPAVVTPSFSCGPSTVSDIDGNIYNTVLIGSQCWTKENLKVTKYNDGTSIPLNNTYTSGTVSTVWQGLTTGAYAIYDNQASTAANATNYGFLYNGYAAKDTRGICPSGWGVPLDADLTDLTNFIGTNPGTKLKKYSSLWLTNTGTDNYGFSALPGGIRQFQGSFQYINNDAFFWSATDSSGSNAWYRWLDKDSNIVNRNPGNKSAGFSVRCLRD
jgi:uncharacterized protein (TIGR02145 family)